jgi:acetylglutamate synthase
MVNEIRQKNLSGILTALLHHLSKANVQVRSRKYGKKLKRELNSTEWRKPKNIIILSSLSTHTKIYQLAILSVHADSRNIQLLFNRRLVSVAATTAAAVTTAAAAVATTAAAAIVVACLEKKKECARVSLRIMRARENSIIE